MAEAEKGGDYDVFADRDVEHPTTDNETFTHLLKSALGSGILGMPIAFMYSGLYMGVFATILTAIICTHCAYILVQCSHVLCFKLRRPKLSFAEVAEISFKSGPNWCAKFAPIAKFTTLFGLFLTYFGTCSCYTVIVARNFQQVLHFYGHAVGLRMFICILLLPCLVLCWIPNLKYLVPVSFCSNIFMLLGLSITCYYLCIGLPSISIREPAHFKTLPQFFAITIFAMEAIGVVMPLENNMATPRHFLGIFGVMVRGMSAVAIIYLFVGFLGYWRFGEEVAGSITLNLPVDELPAQSVKILIALAVFGTFGLQFYVCLEIGWDAIKENYPSKFSNYVLRTILGVLAVLLALAVPTIAPFMGLIGSFCFSILGIILPAFIELSTYYETGYGPCKCMLWKDIFITFCGICALIFGTNSAVNDILEVYRKGVH